MIYTVTVCAYQVCGHITMLHILLFTILITILFLLLLFFYLLVSYFNYVIITYPGRPARSRFTRIQRLTCCLSLLFCTMYSSISFYDAGDPDAPPQPSIRVRNSYYYYNTKYYWLLCSHR